MPNLTDIPSNVSVGFVTANGDPIYYGDYEVRKYLEQHSGGHIIYVDAEGVLHFDTTPSPVAPASVSQRRVVINPQSVGLHATEPSTMTILT